MKILIQIKALFCVNSRAIDKEKAEELDLKRLFCKYFGVFKQLHFQV